MTREQMTREELLKHAYEDQRHEIAYRRSRENEVFVHSAGILVAMTSVLMTLPFGDASLLLQRATLARYLGLILIGGLSVFSIAWQLKQRRHLGEHQRVLATIAQELGLFGADGTGSILPPAWRAWGTRHQTAREQLADPSRVAATAFLGAVTAAALVFVTTSN